MPSLLTLAASTILVLPFLGQAGTWFISERHGAVGVAAEAASGPQDIQDNNKSNDTNHNGALAVTVVEPRPGSANAPVRPGAQATPIDGFRRGQIAHQFRIEQRVTIRISPQSSNNRNELLAQLPQQGVQPAFEEREMDRCVALAGIAGVQTANGNRLLLFLRDERIVTINLEGTCRARDFYSGFYVERNEDGQLCVARDQLLSRSGVKCEIARMSQLVAVDD